MEPRVQRHECHTASVAGRGGVANQDGISVRAELGDALHDVQELREAVSWLRDLWSRARRASTAVGTSLGLRLGLGMRLAHLHPFAVPEGLRRGAPAAAPELVVARHVADVLELGDEHLDELLEDGHIRGRVSRDDEGGVGLRRLLTRVESGRASEHGWTSTLHGSAARVRSVVARTIASSIFMFAVTSACRSDMPTTLWTGASTFHAWRLWKASKARSARSSSLSCGIVGAV